MQKQKEAEKVNSQIEVLQKGINEVQTKKEHLSKITALLEGEYFDLVERMSRSKIYCL